LKNRVGYNRLIQHSSFYCIGSDSLRGFFHPQVPVENLVPVPVAAAYFNEEFVSMKPPKDWFPHGDDDNSYYPEVTVVASHEGQVERAALFRNVLQRLSGREVEFAFISKNRQRRGENKYDPGMILFLIHHVEIAFWTWCVTLAY
jgi:hypothetical protein